MENKILGYMLIIIAIISGISLFIFNSQVNVLLEQQMILSGGNCIIDGECIHEKNNLPNIIGIAAIFFTVALGFYLVFFDRVLRNAEKTQKQIVDALKENKKKKDKNENFEFLLKALNNDEKKIMRALREQEGIEQATLRIRTDLSKTKLSVLLKGLEEKNLVKKVPQGKKNKVYLKNAF